MTKNQIDESFLSKRQLLERLPVSGSTLTLLMRNGTVPFVKLGKRVLFRWPDVESALMKKDRHQ